MYGHKTPKINSGCDVFGLETGYLHLNNRIMCSESNNDLIESDSLLNLVSALQMTQNSLVLSRQLSPGKQ